MCHIFCTWLIYAKLLAQPLIRTPNGWHLEWCSIIGSTTIGETAEERHHGIHQRPKLLENLKLGGKQDQPPVFNKKPPTHRIHVWYIYPHLVDFYGKCS